MENHPENSQPETPFNLESMIRDQQEQIQAQAAQIGQLLQLVSSLTINQVIPETHSLNPVRVQNQLVPTFGRHHAEMIPTFKGELELVQPFLEVTQRLYRQFYDHDDPNNFQNFAVLSSIKGKILSPAAEVIAAADANSYEEIRQAILDSFQDRRDGNTLVIQLSGLRQGENEDPFKFYERVQKILRALTAYVKTHDEGNESSVLVPHYQKLALRVFLMNLKEPLGSALRARNPQSLSAALGIMTNESQISPNQRKSNPQTNKSNPSGGFKFQGNNPQQQPRWGNNPQQGANTYRPQGFTQNPKAQGSTQNPRANFNPKNPSPTTNPNTGPQNTINVSQPNNWQSRQPNNNWQRQQPARPPSRGSWQTSPNVNNVTDSEPCAEGPDDDQPEYPADEENYCSDEQPFLAEEGLEGPNTNS